jgi:hypothetical protein
MQVEKPKLETIAYYPTIALKVKVTCKDNLHKTQQSV